MPPAEVGEHCAQAVWWLGKLRPRQESNLRTRFRKPMLYPLSYEGHEGGGCAMTCAIMAFWGRI